MIAHYALGMATLTVSALSSASFSDRPQTPVRPLPYEERSVEIPATPRSEHLAGTLTLPRGKGVAPAVILVHGGSPFDRDGTFAGHKPLFVLSDELTRAGCATLRLDDRGVGGSKGQKMATTLDDLAHDLEESVRFLRTQPGVRGDRIGLVGHSGGALTAALVASRSPDIAFVVLLGCPARPLSELVAPQLAAEGDGELETNERFGRAAAEIVRSTTDTGEATSRIDQEWRDLVAALPESKRASAERYVSSMSRKLPMLLGTPYLRDVFVFDPEPAIGRITCPVLALWGEFDQGRKLTNSSAWRIARSLAGGASTSFHVAQIPRVNHFMQTCNTGSMSEIAELEETISPEVLREIVDWVAGHSR